MEEKHYPVEVFIGFPTHLIDTLSRVIMPMIEHGTRIMISTGEGVTEIFTCEDSHVHVDFGYQEAISGVNSALACTFAVALVCDRTKEWDIMPDPNDVIAVLDEMKAMAGLEDVVPWIDAAKTHIKEKAQGNLALRPSKKEPSDCDLISYPTTAWVDRVDLRSFYRKTI